MLRDRAMTAACYAASALSGGMIFAHGVRSSAYLPFPVAVVLSNKPWHALLAFLCMFVGTLLARLALNAGLRLQR